MTTTNLIIVILLAVCLIGASLCIVISNLLIKELNQVINNLYAREERMAKMLEKLDKEQAKRIEASEKFKAEIIKNMKARVKPDINVLDFPNDHKD